MATSREVAVLFLSCGRLGYLQRTLHSIQKHIKDLEPQLSPIFMCFDNGSCSEEQDQIKKMGFDRLLLSEKNIGIGPAMNRLLENVSSPWVLNLQDDWIVDNPFCVPFLSASIDFLSSDDRIATVKLDSLHFLDFSDRHRYSEAIQHPNARIQFYVQNPELLWGGFSFPPSVSNAQSLAKIGPFSEERAFQRGWAESEFGHRFSKMFYAVKSPDLLIFEHIGDTPCCGWSRPKNLEMVPDELQASNLPTKRLAMWSSGAHSGLMKRSSDWAIEKIQLCPKSDRKKEGLFFAGPWIGEFGWEVCRWQGGVRKLAQDYFRNHYIIVCGDPGNHPLYDFADEYWTVPKVVRDSDLVRETFRRLPKHLSYPLIAELRQRLAIDLEAYDLPCQVLEPMLFEPSQQTFKMPKPSAVAVERCKELAEKYQIQSWVCCFPRSRKLNPKKNWPQSSWDLLFEELHAQFGVGVIILGRREDTLAIESIPGKCISLLDCAPDSQLDLAVAFLTSSIASIGSECGGPFLALLCGSPTLVMGGTQYKERYERIENPLDTPCTFLEAANYSHVPEKVLPTILSFVDKAKKQFPEKTTLALCSRTKSSESVLSRPASFSSKEGHSNQQISSLIGTEFFSCMFAGVFSNGSTNISQSEALLRAGCKVHQFSYRKHLAEYGPSEMNSRLIAECTAHKPSFVLLSKCNGISIEAVRKCREVCPVVLWYMDGLNNLDEELLLKIANCDFCLFSRRGPLIKAIAKNINSAFLHEGFDPLRDLRMEHACTHQVSFIGELRGARAAYWERLQFETIRGAYGRDHSKAVSSSAINLNFTDARDGTSDRAYKVLAAGGFLLTEPWLGIEEDFRVGKDLVCFEDVDDLEAKVRYYTENASERERIAQSGYASVQKYSRNSWATEVLDTVRRIRQGAMAIGSPSPVV